MNDHSVLFEIVYLLLAAVLFVPIAQKIGLGSVLGYLVAGVCVGPWGLKLITETENISSVSELGVVFLLFIIGLELEPKRLWSWRMQIFGMGTTQIAVIGALIAAFAVATGLSWPTAIVIGAGFALSSTAIATKVLNDRHLLNTSGGSAGFSILLFQDIAVIPILAILPALAGTDSPSRIPAYQIILVIAGIFALGYLFLRRVLRIVASAHLREVFTALSLLLVIGMAAIMHSLGISMALGAFLGGVLLATSEYRTAVETDIEPFKGLLLGLFFMSVGMSINLEVLIQKAGLIFAILAGVIIVKLLAHALLAWTFKITRRQIPLFSILLSQVGEFAFVLFGTATTLGLLTNDQLAIFSAVIALSMATTPLLTVVYDRIWAPRLRASKKDMSADAVRNDHPEVVIAGFGRVGQIVGRLLYANRIHATILDHDPDQIELLRPFGFKVYYGDATRLDLLEAAGTAEAKILVIALDGVEESLRIVDLCKEHFPHLKIIARARNVGHVYSLLERGVQIWERETFDSSLRMGTETLRALGWPAYSAVRAGHKFRAHNLGIVNDMFEKRGDRTQMLSVAKQAREDLEKMFTRENEGLRRHDEHWEIAHDVEETP